MTLRIHICGLIEELLHLPFSLIVTQHPNWQHSFDALDQDLNPACQMRSYLFRTVSFSYKNQNKMSAGRREIAREMKVSNKRTHSL